MIIVTGDTHGSVDVDKIFDFKEQNPHLTKEDYLIVCGDFGLLFNWIHTGASIDTNPADKCWSYVLDENGVIVDGEIWWLKWYQELPFTTLFVDGNHEDFDRLNGYPISEWHGGKVHKITDSVIHLMRGQVYEINGKKFFTFGGAASKDRGPATGTELLDEGTIWWPEEICNKEERDEARENIKKHDNKVDFIITHCLSDKTAMQLGFSDFNPTTQFLSEVEDTVKFKQWFCGHYHSDMWVNTKTRCLYNDVIKVL